MSRKNDDSLGRRAGRYGRRGTALLLCLFTVVFTSVVLLGMMGSIGTQVAAQNATVDYERATYLAGAGIHHALAILQDDISWRGTLSDIAFASGTYSTTVDDGPWNNGPTIVIEGTGTAGNITRTLQVVVD